MNYWKFDSLASFISVSRIFTGHKVCHPYSINLVETRIYPDDFKECHLSFLGRSY